MRQQHTIVSEIETSTIAKDIAETFEQMAATRLLKIRSSVAQTRAFLEEMSSIHTDIREAYAATKHIRKTKRLAFLTDRSGTRPQVVQVYNDKKSVCVTLC